jgi:hypothetical protein
MERVDDSSPVSPDYGEEVVITAPEAEAESFDRESK